MVLIRDGRRFETAMARIVGSFKLVEAAAALGVLLAGTALVFGLFVRELGEIRARAGDDAARALGDFGAEAAALFRPAVDLVDEIDRATLMRLPISEAQRSFFTLAQGPVQRISQLNSAYIGFPDGSFWQHREVIPDFLQGRELPGVIAARGYRRTVVPSAAGPSIVWSFYSSLAKDWVDVPEPGGTYDPRTRPWYATAMAADGGVWTDLYVTASSADLAVSYTQTLRRDDGTLWGVAAIDILSTPLKATLGRWHKANLPAGSTLMAIDTSGNVVARLGEDAPSATETELVARVRENRLAAGNFQIAGQPQVVAFAQLSRTVGLPIVVAAAIPLDALTTRAITGLKFNGAAFGGFLLVLGAILFYALRMRAVSRDIGTMERSTRRIADGELDIDIGGTTRRDAIGGLSRSIEVLRQAAKAERAARSQERVLAARLSAMAADVVRSTAAIRAAASDIANGAADLSARTERQGATVREAMITMFDISAGVRANAEGSQKARTLAEGALARAEMGGKAVASVSGAMGSIQDSSKRIADIVLVMEEIAFQTKLLALNAAVEAARAGETGKGFAVVAQEVRALADRSRQAAHQIRDMIALGTREVGQGVKLTAAAGESLGAILESVRDVAAIAPEIATSSTAQARAIVGIDKAFVELDAATGANATLVERSAAAAAALADQAGRLADAVAEFAKPPAARR